MELDAILIGLYYEHTRTKLESFELSSALRPNEDSLSDLRIEIKMQDFHPITQSV